MSVTVRLTDLAPAVDGVNVIRIVQLAPDDKPVPQLFVCTKFPLLVPVIVMLVKVNAKALVFVRVTD